MDAFPLYTSTLKLIASQLFLEINETILMGSPEIIKLFEANLDMTFVVQKEQEGNVCLANNNEVRPEFKETFASKDLLDYLYAIIHSSAYRKKQKEHLKIDFLNIPIETDKVKFWKLVQLGRKLHEIHLLKSDSKEYCNIQYSKDNDYQSAQKWFQERQKHELIFKDISHSQKIIIALTETIRIVKKIDILDV